MGIVEQKVKDQAYFEAALMVANLTDENANLKQKIEWAIECIDADDVDGAYDWLTEALGGK